MKNRKVKKWRRATARLHIDGSLIVDAGLVGLAVEEEGDAVERVAELRQKTVVGPVTLPVLETHEQLHLVVAAACDILGTECEEQLFQLLDDGGVDAAFVNT